MTLWYPADPAELIDARDAFLEHIAALRPTWYRHAACRGHDPTLFFPERGSDSRAAKKVCATCPVTDQCLQAATYDTVGVWGGTNTQERRQARRSTAA